MPLLQQTTPTPVARTVVMPDSRHVSVTSCTVCSNNTTRSVGVCLRCERNTAACLTCGEPVPQMSLNESGTTCNRCSPEIADIIDAISPPPVRSPERPINPTGRYTVRRSPRTPTPRRRPSAATTPRTLPEVRTWDEALQYVQTDEYDTLKSRRRYGVEIETSSCDNHRPMRNKGSWACVNDGSIDGLEFVSKPMAGDAGIAEIKTLFDHASSNDWKVNSACGLHLHLDGTDLTDEQLFKVARAYLLTYDLWSSFIPQSRKNNYYCAKHFYNPATLDEYTCFKDWVRDQVGGERYCWINFGAYLQHGTIELRNHTATLNNTKLKNWIRAHLRFIDTVKDMTMGEIMAGLNGTTLKEQYKFVSDTWNSDHLTEWYGRRAAHFGNEVI